MTRYIQGRDGKFAGSIGDGKTKTPSPSDLPRAAGTESEEAQVPDYAAMQALVNERALVDRPDHPKWGEWDRENQVYRKYTHGGEDVWEVRDAEGLLHSPNEGDIAYRTLDDNNWIETQRTYWHGVLLTEYDSQSGALYHHHSVDWDNIHPDFGIWDISANAYMTTRQTTENGQTIKETTFHTSEGLLHRDGTEPALTRVQTSANGVVTKTAIWARNGQPHRTGGAPAAIRQKPDSTAMAFYENGQPVGSEHVPGEPTVVMVSKSGNRTRYTRAWQDGSGRPTNGPDGLPAVIESEHAGVDAAAYDAYLWGLGAIPQFAQDNPTPASGGRRWAYANSAGTGLGPAPGDTWSFHMVDSSGRWTAALADDAGNLTRIEALRGQMIPYTRTDATGNESTESFVRAQVQQWFTGISGENLLSGKPLSM